MDLLPKRLHVFIYWWLIKEPKNLFDIVKRLILIINSSISFTVNLKLIFTPLFGDYTIVGRLIGFTVRIFEIVFGSIIVIVLSIVAIILPILWWAAPFYFFMLYKLWLIPFIALSFLIWLAVYRNTPVKKIKQINKDEYLKATRPHCVNIINTLESDLNKGLEVLLKHKRIKYLLKKSELDTNEFQSKIIQSPRIDFSQFGDTLYTQAKNSGSRYIELEHVFTAVLALIPKIDIVMATFGVSLDLLIKSADWVVGEREKLDKLFIWQVDYENILTGGTGKGMTGRVTPFLDAMSEDFTKEALKGGYKRYAVRDTSIKKVAELLSGSNQNLLIIGAPGCGKTSVVKGIAYKIMEGNEYPSLSNKRIVSLELSGIVSGTKGIGDIAEKLKWAIREAKGSGDIILFIDEIHTLIGDNNARNPEINAIYSLLEPELASNTIQFIGATTIQNYRKFIEPNGAFSRLFNMLEIDEATKEETLEILKYDSVIYESKYNIIISYPALNKTVDLSKKLMHERVLPDKAVQILGRATTKIARTTQYLTTETVELEVAEITHVPAAMVSEDEAVRLLNIEVEMQKSVIGQDHAIKQIGSALKRARAGVRNENKPIASFLFVGTTGVGKTQTAKSLSQTYFGDIKNMVRLDMSEYQQLDSISRLLGTPDGEYKGILTESIRTKPFSLILLDEIEKAHPNILLTFLQVLDDGRLTDPTGMVIDFTNTIIISTSNVGTRSIQAIFEKKGTIDEMTSAAMQDVRSFFAPEFLNRFTGVIVFNPLTLENVRKITILLLADVIKSADAKNIKISFKNEVVEELLKRGYNPEWGARPMARAIEDTVESYLAVKILSKEFKPGDEIVIGMEAFEQ